MRLYDNFYKARKKVSMFKLTLGLSGDDCRFALPSCIYMPELTII